MTQASSSGVLNAPDIPLTVLTPPSYPNPVRAERRITPSWSLATLKRKLEPVIGIPPSAQRLLLRWPDGREAKVEVNGSGGEEEEGVSIGQWGLVRYAELEVSSTHPPHSSISTTTTTSSNQPPPQNPLSPTAYAQKPSTVLAYKRTHQLGRFDPAAPARLAARQAGYEREIERKGVREGVRCRVGGDDDKRGSNEGGGGDGGRRGTVRYIGEVPELPGGGGGGGGGKWVGVELDEPVGRNDGSVAVAVTVTAGAAHEGEIDGDETKDVDDHEDVDEDAEESAEQGRRNDVERGRKRYFQADRNHGIFVRPERVMVGDFPVLSIEDELNELGSDMEEL